MKNLSASFVVFGFLAALSGQAQQSVRPDTGPAVNATARSDHDSSRLTPAEQRIAVAQRQVAANPGKANPFEDLGIAYLRRARETDDSRFLAEAEQAFTQGLKIDPTDFQLQKEQVALMLARHQYAAAKDKATALNRRTPDDVMTYGYLSEAEIALGNYDAAEKSAQWMLNMRPNNLPGLLLGARLRVLYGDTDGALEMLNLAYSETSPGEVEDQAWIANQIAAIEIDSGKSEAAEALLQRTDELFPNYPYTLANLARVRLEQHRAQDAIVLLSKARQLTDNPESIYRLAVAEEEAGDARAAATYAEFEAAMAHPASATDDSVRDLILVYAKNPATAPKGLALAQEQISLRHDVWTLDAYAWALYANGHFAEADAQEQKAMAVGIQSAQIFNHAGHIAQKLGRADEADKYFARALQADAGSEYAVDARKSLGLSAAGNPIPSNVHRDADEALTGIKDVAPITSSAPATEGAARGIPAFAPVPAKLLTPLPTDTDRLIRNAQAIIAHNPKDAAGYSALGAAHFQRARETGDVSDYQLAEDSLNKSLDLLSNDFAADEPLGTMAEVCMGEHRFNDALAYSQKALSLGSGDVSPFAIVGDAYADMGEYDKAAGAYARLTPRDMTLSPRAAYARDSRLAYLKFIGGDTSGAIALMKIAVAEGTAAQLPSENLAWLYYELGEFYVQAGQPASADTAYVSALTVHPGDYRALAGLAKLRANNGKNDEAILLYQKAIAVVPMPIFVGELGDLYTKLGNQLEAKKQYQLVEYIGLLGHINQVLHNRDLAIFYADHDTKLTEALDLAQKELEVRHDVYTWDAVAWALYKNGKIEEAVKADQNALRFGTKDSLLLFHAGMIAERAGQRERARAELAEALRINPHFHVLFAPEAEQQVALLSARAATGGSDAR